MMLSKWTGHSRPPQWRLFAVLSFVAGFGLQMQGAGFSFKVLAPFDGADGRHPVAGMVRASDGNFHGTTAYGGAFDQGTVFQVTPEGVLTTLASFDGANGSGPVAPLLQDTNGNFFGTTQFGGPFDKGTLFQVTSNGALTTLCSFDGTNGANPLGGLIQGADGSFYGTTFRGGDQEGHGTVFQFTTNSALITLILFDGTNGANPAAGLAMGNDGNFYGTTVRGGDTNGHGTVFQLSPGGTLTTLIQFNGTNSGANPYAALLKGADGIFYGVTANGGTNDAGTVFRFAPDGGLSTLYHFKGRKDGGQPFAELMRGNDGNFYGTTTANGTQKGTIFRTSTAGDFTTLARFSPGQEPAYNSTFVQGLDGNFYGVTYSGTKEKLGSVFKFATARRPVINIVSPNRRSAVGSNDVLYAEGRARADGGLQAVYVRAGTNEWIQANTEFENSRYSWVAKLSISETGAVPILAYALDFNGQTSLTNSVEPALVVPVLPLIVRTNGFGKVSPNYNGKLLALGATYSVTAIPRPGCIFTNWSCNLTNWPGLVPTNDPQLSFVMVSNLILTANFADVTPPTVELTSPSPDSTKPLRNAALVVVGKLSDNTVASVFYQLNNNRWTRAPTGYLWWVAKLALAPGTNTFQFYAADLDGNVSGITQTVFVYEPR